MAANDGSIPEKESSPTDIDMLQLCTNNNHLVSHFTSQQGTALLRSI